MSESVVEEVAVSFKELEQKIFRYVCELGQELTRIVLEEYDERLARERDRSRYRNKGLRTRMNSGESVP